MKKAVSAFLSAVMLMSSFVVWASESESRWQSDKELSELLSALDIMVGDENGDFNFDGYVTRAQMAKIAVASSSAKNTVAVGLQFSPFSDVKGTYWGAPYIRAAVSAGYVDGYIDGTYKPDNTVTYEEAITIMLRVLGYSEEDFGASYPYGQVGTARSLKLTDGISRNIGDAMTRRDVAKLVSNALDTKSKTTGQDLISVHDCQFIEDVTIIASNADDKTLGSDEISTSAGKYRIDSDFDDSYVGCRGDMVVKDGKYFVAFSSDSDMASGKYVVYSTLNDAIICYADGNNTEVKQFKIKDSTTCYKDSVSYTYGSVRSQIEMGDIVRIRYRSDGEIDYISLSDGSMDGPIRVSGENWINNFDINSQTKIMRDGKQVAQSSIELNDIVYYSSSLNMVMAYTRRFTGVYEDAIPSKDLPQKVVISGVTYEVEGAEAFGDLSSSGSCNIGDTITVLMGSDGEKIAGVAKEGESTSKTITGYIISSGKKEFKNSDGTSYTSYYIEAVTAYGTVYTYPTNYDKSSLVNRVSRITIKDGKADISGQVTVSTLSGEVSYKDMTMCGKRVADNVKIIDVVKDAYSDVPLYTKTYMQRLDGMTLSQGQILYYDTNSNGEIDEVFLSNATGDMYQYGIVTAVSTVQATDGSQYLVTIESNNQTYSISGVNGMSVGAPVRFAPGTAQAEFAVKLRSISGTVSELSQGYAVIGDEQYTLSDKVQVYRKTGTKYLSISINDAINGDYYYSCYSENTDPINGRVRVIVVRDK